MAGDKVVGRNPNSGSRVYYHADLLGSTLSVVTGATVTDAYEFEPFGLLMPGPSLVGGTKERFTGKEEDSESGLTYFGARYYLSALGRWAGPDPVLVSFPNGPPTRTCSTIHCGSSTRMGWRQSAATSFGILPRGWPWSVLHFQRGRPGHRGRSDSSGTDPEGRCQRRVKS
jgi:RHS repeat-associated protein